MSLLPGRRKALSHLRLASFVAVVFARVCMCSFHVNAQDGVGLADLTNNSGLDIGFEVSPEILGDSRFTNIVAREANAGTVGVYWLEGGFRGEGRDVFDWTRPDSVVAFLESDGIKIYGTPLFWPADIHTPPWVFEINQRKHLEATLREHVSTVVDRYRGRVAQWVVVNEAFTFEGEYQNSHWLSKLGHRGIQIAFREAAAADPNAELIINDYGLVEKDARKFNAVVREVQRLRRRGLRVDGVGFQLHLHAGQVLDPDFPLERRLRIIKSMGLPVYVTELDIVLPDAVDFYVPEDRPIPEQNAENLQIQKDAYKKVVETYLRVFPTGSIQTWGISDVQSWLGVEQFPLLFDADLNRKPAYEGVAEALVGDISGIRRLRNLLTGGQLYLDPTFQWDGAIVQAVDVNNIYAWWCQFIDNSFDPIQDAGQVWTIANLDADGTYRIKSNANDRFLNVNGFDNQPVNTYPYFEGWIGQKWQFRHIGAGRYVIQNAWTERYLQPQLSWWMLFTANNATVDVNTSGSPWMAIWEIEYLPKPASP